jgi:HAD superfamily hydrolase (TIGR01509 family)
MEANGSPIGLIFDFDGVIALSEPTHEAAWRDVAEHFARELPDSFAEKGMGTPDRFSAVELARHWGEPATGERVLAAKQRFYRDRVIREAVLVPGIMETVRHFAGRLPMAIATSSGRDDLEPWFRGADLERHFSAILTIESVRNPKPHPEIYLAAAAALNLPPRRCVVFEDSVQGAKAARAAGTRLIGVTTTFDAETLAPLDIHLPDFSDLDLLIRHLECFSDSRS